MLTGSLDGWNRCFSSDTMFALNRFSCDIAAGLCLPARLGSSMSNDRVLAGSGPALCAVFAYNVPSGTVGCVRLTAARDYLLGQCVTVFPPLSQ